MTLRTSLEALQTHLATELTDYQVVLGYPLAKAKSISITIGAEDATLEGGLEGYRVNTEVVVMISNDKPTSSKNIYKSFLDDCVSLQTAIQDFVQPTLQYSGSAVPETAGRGTALIARQFSYIINRALET